MDEEMKRFLQEELKKEADQIMREVEADPEVADLTAPSEIDQKLYEQIKQYKEEHYAPEETLSGEQQELIRLGKIYKRKQKRRKRNLRQNQPFKKQLFKKLQNRKRKKQELRL